MTPITNWFRDTFMARSKKTKSEQQAQDQQQVQPTTAPQTAPTSTPAQAAQPSQASAPAQAESQDQEKLGTQPMKKGIYLSAMVYIEGMQAPGDDFAAL